MKVVALAGGVGAGKFLRGLVRAVPGKDLTVVVNTGDDLDLHGLRICPDLDSVTYWLGDAFDRERGWGRRDETFRANQELRAFDPDAAWFGLGDLDLATHLFRTRELAAGRSLSEVTRLVAARFSITAGIGPMTARKLLRAFGSVAGVQGAGPEEWERVAGRKAAAAIARWATPRAG